MLNRLTVRMRLGMGLSAFLRVADFRGRSTRTEICCFFAVLILFDIVAMVIAWVSGFGAGFPDRDSSRHHAIVVLVLEHLPLLPIFALTVRRMHDIGIPGWPGAANAALMVVLVAWDTLADRTTGIARPSTGLETVRVVSLLAFYTGLFWVPTRGPNRYGPDPRGAGPA